MWKYVENLTASIDSKSFFSFPAWRFFHVFKSICSQFQHPGFNTLDFIKYLDKMKKTQTNNENCTKNIKA
jgi:hypothetical protein